MSTASIETATTAQALMQVTNPYFSHLEDIGRARGWTRSDTHGHPTLSIPGSEIAVVLEPNTDHLRLLHTGRVLTSLTLARHADLDLTPEAAALLKRKCVAQINLQLKYERA